MSDFQKYERMTRRIFNCFLLFFFYVIGYQIMRSLWARPYKDTRHVGKIAYHFYDGGRTAIGLKGTITTILAPPSSYGFEIDGHAVKTTEKAWYANSDGQKVVYWEIRNALRVKYSTELQK